MITAYDVNFSTYMTTVGHCEAEVWDDGDIVIMTNSGESVVFKIKDMLEVCSVAAEFIEERKKVKAQ